ncbi:hypothetical protein Tco_1446365 [Tanacetum coccineum]
MTNHDTHPSLTSKCCGANSSLDTMLNQGRTRYGRVYLKDSVLSRKVRKGKPSFQLVDEDDEAQQESVPQGESDDPALELAKKMSLDAHQEKGEGRAPVGGVTIRDPVSETTPILLEVVGKGVKEGVKDHKRKHDSVIDDEDMMIMKALASAAQNHGMLHVKPIQEDERPATPRTRIDHSLPSNDFPEPENNWANAYATSYQVPAENKIQRKTYDIVSYINGSANEHERRSSAKLIWKKPGSSDSCGTCSSELRAIKQSSTSNVLIRMQLTISSKKIIRLSLSQEPLSTETEKLSVKVDRLNEYSSLVMRVDKSPSEKLDHMDKETFNLYDTIRAWRQAVNLKDDKRGAKTSHTANREKTT